MSRSTAGLPTAPLSAAGRAGEAGVQGRPAAGVHGQRATRLCRTPDRRGGGLCRGGPGPGLGRSHRHSARCRSARRRARLRASADTAAAVGFTVDTARTTRQPTAARARSRDGLGPGLRGHDARRHSRQPQGRFHRSRGPGRRGHDAIRHNRQPQERHPTAAAAQVGAVAAGTRAPRRSGRRRPRLRGHSVRRAADGRAASAGQAGRRPGRGPRQRPARRPRAAGSRRGARRRRPAGGHRLGLRVRPREGTHTNDPHGFAPDPSCSRGTSRASASRVRSCAASRPGGRP